MKLAAKDNKIFLKFSPSDNAAFKLAKKAGFRWSMSEKAWWAHDTFMAREALEFIFPDATFDLPEKGYYNMSLSDYAPNEKLMKHQSEGVEMSIYHDRWCYFFDTGTGKTLTAIEIIRLFDLKTLIVCPLSIIEAAWMEDIAKFAPQIRGTVINLWKQKGKKRLFNALQEFQICIINYESFRSNFDMIREAGFDMVICDESSKLKNNKSQITKKMIQLTDDVSHVYLLSGTPAPNSKLEYWPQMRMMNIALLGASFYAFRNEYFTPKGYGGFQYEEKTEKSAELLHKISQFSTVVRKEDVLDLPERVDQIRDVILTSDEIKAYNNMKRHMLIEIEEGCVSAANAAVKLMKLRQLTGGFLITEDKAIRNFGDSKLKALLDLLEEIGNHQVIIWTQFQYEALMIQIELQGMECVINGTIPQTIKERRLKEFKAGNIQYLIAHPRSLGHGVTLTDCSYAIYYSGSYSHEEHYQSRDRIYRKGQENKCAYYYLVAPGTIDEIIYKALQSKADISESVLKEIQGG